LIRNKYTHIKYTHTIAIYHLVSYNKRRLYSRILKNKPFSQWAKRLKITDKLLIATVDEMINGLYEANLGSHI